MECTTDKIVLSNYDISVKRGFIPENQIAELGGIFAPWEEVLSSLSSHIRSKTLQKEIEALPELEFSDTTLRNIQEWRRAFSLLSFLSQAYLRMDDELPDKLPEKLAKPWVAVSERLGMKPFLSYAVLILYNFHLRDESRPVEIENISILDSFTGLEDESWFYVVNIVTEIAAAPGLIAIANAYTHMASKDFKAVGGCLEELSQCIDRLKEESSLLFKKVDETPKCSPDVFFGTFIPFFNHLPKPVVYEGTGDEPRNYTKASGAQTSTIYAFDIFLGVQHSDGYNKFATDIRQYMPHGHRKFLEKLESMPSVRQFCKDSKNEDLISSYNKAIESTLIFRNFHLKKLIGEYVFGPAMRAKPRQPSLDKDRGNKLSAFLNSIIEETKQARIS